ncbi:uncharacterized protein B0H18DRAFT_113985 [Fomitopsis serialis]|uniref:uncharacterized protein n=1 Tax=Fomitopsis serialis TaxID=139415 RepID=UPI002007CF83|nr:uncharacterized protein B0H18DRAFT_113985 [Neoantrodia serialis]KAH9914923.1 hypothetical protein B0H18DRAFT_113985 [Neoantrodia serialis]
MSRRRCCRSPPSTSRWPLASPPSPPRCLLFNQARRPARHRSPFPQRQTRVCHASSQRERDLALFTPRLPLPSQHPGFLSGKDSRTPRLVVHPSVPPRRASYASSTSLSSAPSCNPDTAPPSVMFPATRTRPSYAIHNTGALCRPTGMSLPPRVSPAIPAPLLTHASPTLATPPRRLLVAPRLIRNDPARRVLRPRYYTTPVSVYAGRSCARPCCRSYA